MNDPRYQLLIVSSARRHLTEDLPEAVATAARGLELSPAEVALRWLLQRPTVASAVLGARTGAQLKELLACSLAPLPAQISEVLDEVSAPR